MTPADVLADILETPGDFDEYRYPLLESEARDLSDLILAALAERGYGVSKVDVERLLQEICDQTYDWGAASVGVARAVERARKAIGWTTPNLPPARPVERQVGSLDAAWAAAEAALPEGWHIGLSQLAADDYEAEAFGADDRVFSVAGPTPAAALDALAAQLNQAGRKEPDRG